MEGFTPPSEAIRRKPAAVWSLVCLALIVLGFLFVFGHFGTMGTEEFPPPPPPETSDTPMRKYIPDAGFPSPEEPEAGTGT